MKILSVGDIHNRASFRRWILDQAPRFDAVCLVGDLLDMFDTDEAGLRRQAESTLKWLSAFPSGTRVFAVTGNHDAWQDETPAYDQGAWLQRARRPGVSVDGDVVRVGDITFVCYPWFGMPSTPYDGEVVAVCHSPPSGLEVSCDREGGGDLGDFDVRLLAEQIPNGSALLSGHVHLPVNWISRFPSGARRNAVVCLNSGCDLNAPIPHHLVLDTVRRRIECYRYGQRSLVEPF